MKEILKEIVVQILTWEARLTLRKTEAKVAAVTGSVGKTSTKEALAAVLGRGWRVVKSEKSYNSEIGLPLAILGLKSAWGNILGWAWNILRGLLVALGFRRSPEWFVLEVGADAPGDIEKASKWIASDIVVLTRFPHIPVHVEAFGTPARVIREKLFLVKSLKPGGALVLNYDDREVMKVQKDSGHIVFSYGFDPGAGVWASNYSILYEDSKPVGVTFRVDYAGSSVPIRIYGVLGRQHAYAALAGLAAGVSQGINLVQAGEALAGHQTPPGRMRIIKGLKGSVIIDDSYNSSPAAAISALDTLEELNVPGKRIAVLGDMAELGNYSERAHKEVGAKAARMLDALVTVGSEARNIAQGALEFGMNESQVFQFDDSQKAGKFVELRLNDGDVVLVKGSQKVRTEKVVEEIMLHPEQKEQLLVRQEREWQNR